VSGAVAITAPQADLTGATDPIILPSSYFEGLDEPDSLEAEEADMETTRLSTKGQVIIPKDIREATQWTPGQELEVRLTKEGVLLKTPSPFPETRIEDVAGSLWRPGMKMKTEKEIKEGLRKSMREAWLGRS
jgi:AbrB family looped-hinge helix DNA binding protein